MAYRRIGRRGIVVAAVLTLLLAVSPVRAEDAPAPGTADALAKGRAWLVSKQDAGTGGWGDRFTGGVSAGYSSMVVAALVGATPRADLAKDPVIAKALEFVASAQKPSGAIASSDRFVNYETAAAVLAFASARVTQYGPVQAKAREYLVSLQVVGDENAPDTGGFPYSPGQSTDLSNVQFAATALHDAELPADSPVWKRLQTYLAKVQNRSETNTFVAKGKVGDTPVDVVSGDDGGAVYAPGTGKGDLVKRPDGRYENRSYGSMTYALLKCLLFSGAKADDPRVVAAVGWISKNFTVDRNPGFETAKDPQKAGQQGYYYYLLTMARALATYEKALGKPFAVTDEAGRAHDWRKEVAARLLSLQRPDGSFVNEVAERWDEGNPLLATAYAVQALAITSGRLP
jgi:squalene-hopene/tetraprenyl-beta-curcumene cyclase